jgi:hypothetical protein
VVLLDVRLCAGHADVHDLCRGGRGGVTTVASIVRHPQTGRPGAFVPWDLVQQWSEARWVGPLRRAHALFRGGYGGGEGLPCGRLATCWREYLQASEFDPQRDFEVIPLHDAQGYGVFYL